MYELDNRKDQVMSACKVALANLGMWMRQQYWTLWANARSSMPLACVGLGIEASGEIIGPIARQIEFSVNQDRSMPVRVGQENPIWQLAILPAVPLYWAATPTDFFPFLRKTSLIHHQDGF